jgi:Protein involved in D-alanine esterification of lipoteichoic acid and wall teichoic acid (D-alanine transfer protein)
MIAIHHEQSTISSTAPEIFSLKNQGLAFQRAAGRARDMLPLYGSSELQVPKIPERAAIFFRNAPTGFQVSPVGKIGTISLIMLQEIGALGSDLRDKKLAISLSPGWFLARETNPRWYEGNFSPIAASKLVFGNTIDFSLKRQVAARMLQFPRTLEKNPLLEFALRRLVSGRPLDRIVFWIIWPLGKIQNVVMDIQDHFAALNYILREAKSAPPRHPKILDWPKLIAEAGERGVRSLDKNENGKNLGQRIVTGRRDDKWFREHVNEGREWADLELLLRTLAKIDARPLLLSMPLDGQYYNQTGVSRSAREVYYKKLRGFAQQYNIALIDFHEHDEDPTFLQRPVRQGEPAEGLHLAAKGWMLYNRALDDFFHGRVPPM